MENGLPQNTVQALLQTRDGFVWLGTEVGLVRFDGNSFQVFDRTSTPALPGNDIHCLLRDARRRPVDRHERGPGAMEGRRRDSTFTTRTGCPGTMYARSRRSIGHTVGLHRRRPGAAQRRRGLKQSGDWRPGAVIPTLTGGGQTGSWIDADPHCRQRMEPGRRLQAGLPKEDCSSW